jgi:xylulokinase
MPKNLLLGLDSSTTACKAVVWDRAGNPVALGRAAHVIDMPRPGWHEQPAESWWDVACNALRDAAAQIDIARLAAICITHQRETFVVLDEHNTALRPAILWMDERCRSLLPGIENDLGRQNIHTITGKPLSGNLTLGKIAWIKAHEPQVFQHAAKYLDVAAYLNFRLTGLFHTGWGCADPTGLFDLQQNDWSADILAYLGITRDQLPQAFPAWRGAGRSNTGCGRPMRPACWSAGCGGPGRWPICRSGCEHYPPQPGLYQLGDQRAVWHLFRPFRD